MERLTHRQMEYLKGRLLEDHRAYLERRAERGLPPFHLKLRGQRAILIAYGGAFVVEMPAKALLEHEALKRRGF